MFYIHGPGIKMVNLKQISSLRHFLPKFLMANLDFRHMKHATRDIQEIVLTGMDSITDRGDSEHCNKVYIIGNLTS